MVPIMQIVATCSLHVCLAVSVCVCLCVCVCVSVSVYVSVCLSLSVYVSVCVGVCMYVHLYVLLSLFPLMMSLSVCSGSVVGWGSVCVRNVGARRDTRGHTVSHMTSA